ncbi:MAG: hypothetical protein WCX65_00600 [bacterium]
MIAMSGPAIAAPSAPAAPAAKPAAAKTAPAPAAVQPAVVPEAKPAEVVPSAEEIIAGVKAAYAPITSYTVIFEMVQMIKPVNKRDEIKEKKAMNIFEMKYLRPDPEKKEWLMRLTALRGNHQRTVAVYAPDKKGKGKYTVYKPAGKVVVSPDDPRATGLAMADLHSFIADIETSAAAKDAKTNVAYLSGTNQYSIEIAGDAVRTTTYVDRATFHLVRQVLELKTRGGYGFKQEISWRDFKPNAKLSPEAITKAPAKL